MNIVREERGAIAYQPDPLTNERLIASGRAKDALFYSSVSFPLESPHEDYGPATAHYYDEEIITPETIVGKSFGLILETSSATGLTVVRLNLARTSLEAAALVRYAKWSTVRSGGSVGDDIVDQARELAMTPTDLVLLEQAAGDTSIASMSVRCLGIRVMGSRPTGRDRFQLIDGEKD